MQRTENGSLIIPKVTEADIAKSHKDEIDVKLRELCALMNVARGDGFLTHFNLGASSDGRYRHSDLFLSKRF